MSQTLAKLFVGATLKTDLTTCIPYYRILPNQLIFESEHITWRVSRYVTLIHSLHVKSLDSFTRRSRCSARTWISDRVSRNYKVFVLLVLRLEERLYKEGRSVLVDSLESRLEVSSSSFREAEERPNRDDRFLGARLSVRCRGARVAVLFREWDDEGFCSCGHCPGALFRLEREGWSCSLTRGFPELEWWMLPRLSLLVCDDGFLSLIVPPSLLLFGFIFSLSSSLLILLLPFLMFFGSLSLFLLEWPFS